MTIDKEPFLAAYSAPLKFIGLIILLLLSLLFTSIFGIAFALPFWGFDVLDLIGNADYNNPQSLSLLKYLQVVNQLGFFVIPPLLFAYWVSRKIADYLQLNVKPEFRAIIISTMIIFVSLPFISWLGEINRNMILPQSLAGIQAWMERMENEANKLIMAFLKVKSLRGMIFNVFMVALMPAIGEEFLFRGVVLRLFKEWTKNLHLAILFSAILFSALHLQFYGFLPRLVLGLLLGYAFVWSGSLWIPMLIHFLNNAFAIIYIYATGSLDLIDTDIESIGTSDNALVIVTSGVLMIFLLLIMYKWYKDRKQMA